MTREVKDLALMAARAAAEKKATDIVALDVAKLLVVTDYFIICTGNTDRQVRTIAEEVEITLKRAGFPAIGVEGEAEGKWVLIDFVDVVVHVFQPEERDFYRLEKLWSDAPRLELPEDVTGEAAAPSAESELQAEPQPGPGSGEADIES